ncbi:polysaccharide pyruvyl transferase family protein [Dongia sedimenti]|uniref:Polysaccharide pyruvyl transferase family protein n=1 Tax=Dongia sedimenti TaxID=3064282 RepID=A0ABU0YR81_9PROT|nr:polysaccharide pyruvyl transferase family protein [Rhodospirillaceae bacterium R-7]
MSSRGISAAGRQRRPRIEEDSESVDAYLLDIPNPGVSAMTVALFDPSIASENLGDQIIIDAVVREISDLFPAEQVVHLPTQEVVGRRTFRIARNARERLVGGTNLLSSHMLRYRQWKVGLAARFLLKDVVLMGVGWWQYQDDPDWYTRQIILSTLSKRRSHAVRDEYTKQKLEKIGLANVLNTGCPTMWRLDEKLCASIPARKASDVVFTLTDYKPNRETDVALIDLLRKRYARLFFWPQGSGDLAYLQSIAPLNGIEMVAPTLAAYDALLDSHDLDFVGTRLHGGIRALQKRRRALIVAVDNRSLEISRDTGLPTEERKAVERISDRIERTESTRLALRLNEIAAWKTQFSAARAAAQ